MTIKTHIRKVVSSCYYQLPRICTVCRLVGKDVAQQLVSAFTLSRLDYCNSVLSRLSRSTIQPLQRVLNAAACVIVNLSEHDHVTPAPKEPHWLCQLSRESCTSFVYSCTFTSDRLHNIWPTACSLFPQPVADTCWGRLTLPWTRTKFGERGVCYSGPAAWNGLPSELHDISDTNTFTNQLKSILFDRAYQWLL